MRYLYVGDSPWKSQSCVVELFPSLSPKMYHEFGNLYEEGRGNHESFISYLPSNRRPLVQCVDVIMREDFYQELYKILIMEKNIVDNN